MRLFVGNLPYDVTEQEVREFFSSVGTLTFLHLPVDRLTGKPRGFAFVEFAEEEQARQAIEKFNQALFGGRPLSINEARAPGSPPPPRPEYRPRPPSPQGERTESREWGGAPSDEFSSSLERPHSTRRKAVDGGPKKKRQRDHGEKAPRRAAHTRTSRILDEYDFEEDQEHIDVDNVARKADDEE